MPILKNNCSGEFLLSGAKIKSTGKMKEGTVPLPLYHLYAEIDDDVVPVQVLSHFLGNTKRQR